MSESGPIGNGLNVRNSGTDELQAGRLFKRTQQLTRDLVIDL